MINHKIILVAVHVELFCSLYTCTVAMHIHIGHVTARLMILLKMSNPASIGHCHSKVSEHSVCEPSQLRLGHYYCGKNNSLSHHHEITSSYIG